MAVWFLNLISHIRIAPNPPTFKKQTWNLMENTVRKTKGSVILRKERVALWVNPEKPGNEERIAGNRLKGTELRIGKKI